MKSHPATCNSPRRNRERAVPWKTDISRLDPRPPRILLERALPGKSDISRPDPQVVRLARKGEIDIYES